MTGTKLLVTAAIAPMLAEPRANAEQVSQRLAGHELEILEVRTPWFRTRGCDGYEGWMHSGYVRTMPSREIARRYAAGRISLGCVAMSAEGRRTALPLGARLADDDRVESGEALSADELRARFPHDPAAVAETARKRFEGTPYQWGGITPWGADCSGLVQTSFSLHGFRLPRDAWQQAECGSPVNADLASLQTGDLVFFSEREDRRATHVAIGLGDGAVVHSAIARGGWAIDRLTRSEDAYVSALRSRIIGARRLTTGG
jgi:cell wall-associated NlpC family hydrolase